MNAEFQGQWVRKGGILVPVITDHVERTCRVCGCLSPVGLCRPCRDSSRKRVHGSHQGFNQHQRRNELPCQACSDAEKVYQNKRYRRGQLSKTDLAWAEKNAVKMSWVIDARANRRASVANTREETTT